MAFQQIKATSTVSQIQTQIKKSKEHKFKVKSTDQKLYEQIKSYINRSKDHGLDQQIKIQINRSKSRSTDQKLDLKLKWHFKDNQQIKATLTVSYIQT